MESGKNKIKTRKIITKKIFIICILITNFHLSNTSLAAQNNKGNYVIYSSINKKNNSNIKTTGIKNNTTNFLNNISYPIRFTKDILQCDVKSATIETIRFLTNTTFGIAGFEDYATTELNIPNPNR